MSREPVHTEKAPKAIGPYEQAIKANGMVYTSGQIPIDPKDREFCRRWHQRADPAGYGEFASGAGSRRLIARPRRQSHGVFETNKRLRRHERNLRGVSRQRQAGKVDGRGGRFAARRAGGNRFGGVGLIGSKQPIPVSQLSPVSWVPTGINDVSRTSSTRAATA